MVNITIWMQNFLQTLNETCLVKKWIAESS